MSVCSAEDAAQLDLMSMFPDLFGCVYIFANSKGWNSKTPLKEMFRTGFPRVFKPDEHLKVPVQESQLSSTERTTK